MSKIIAWIQQWQAIVRFIGEHPLTKQHVGSACLRVLRWQIHRRTSHGPMKVPFVNGGHLLLEPGAHGLTGFFYVGLPDFEEAAFALHLLRPGENFADVGANAGAWSIMAAQGARAKVDAFEQIPSSLARLTKNVESNALENDVFVHGVGVGSQVGKLAFTTTQDTGNRVASSEDAAGELLEVPVTTLDQVLHDRCPVLIKIDVEGWELEVIKGAQTLLREPSLLALIIETFREHNLSTPMLYEMEALLAEHGFRPCAYHPFQRRLGALDSKARSTDNTIYVRDMEAVQVRLRNADDFSILGQKV